MVETSAPGRGRPLLLLAACASPAIPLVAIAYIVLAMSLAHHPGVASRSYAPHFLGAGLACAVGILLAFASLFGMKANGRAVTLLGAILGFIMNVCVGAACFLVWAFSDLRFG
jgi:hypothetical protein